MAILPLYEYIKKLFKNTEFVSGDGEFLVGKICEAIERLDKNLVALLLKDAKTKEHFFVCVEDAFVLDQNKLFDFFNSREYFDSSYTSYTNKIGLIRKDSFIKKFDDVVLVWPYKDCVLEGGMSSEDKGKNEVFYNSIISKDEIDRLFEPKVLANIKKYTKEGESIPDEITMDDNLIIKGNNLLALHSLKKQYAGKVKLIYIDPPYNTGNDGFKYNDRFNHSTWLTFMKNRLEVARELLCDNGAIFIQIDYKELAYLKVLSDEIFKDNFVQLISVKTASPAGFKTVNPGPIDVTEYILFYTKNKASFNFKKGYVPIKYDENYDLVITNIEDNPEDWVFEKIVNVVYLENDIELGQTYQQSNKNAQKKWGKYWKTIRYELIADYALQNAEKVVSIRDPHKPTEKLKKLLDESKKIDNKIFIHKKETKEVGNDFGDESYIINGGVLSFYSNKIQMLDGIRTPTELLTDFWSDLSWAGIAKEGSVTLKNGKKPEKLLQRIVELTTQENDIVLDFHLGSGTTAAVAHKMGRRYIGIEQMDYIETIAVERMKKVCEGEQGGISKAVNWQGGGSFVYAELKAIDNFKDEDVIGALNQNMRYLPIGEIDDEEYGIGEAEKKLNKQFYGIA